MAHRRKFLKGAGVAAASSLAGCIGGSSQETQPVTLQIAAVGGTAAEWWTDIFWEPFAENTPHDYEHNVMDSGGQMIANIQANRDDPNIHIPNLNSGQSAQLEAQEMLVPVDEYVKDEIPEDYLTSGNSGYTVTPWGIAVNSDATDVEVTGWQDLLNPELQGQVAIPNWGWMGSTWLYAVDNALGGQNSEQNPEKGFEFVRKLIQDQDAVIVESVEQVNGLFQSGDIVAAPFWNARTDQLSLNYDVPAEFVYPEEGTQVVFWGWPIVVGHSEEEREACETFVNDYTLDPEAQAEWSNKTGYLPSHPDAMEYVSDETLETYPSMELTEARQESLQKIDISWSETVQNREDHSEQWRRIVRG